MLEESGFTAFHFRPKKDRIDKNGLLQKAVVPLQASDLMAYETFDPLRKIERDGYLRSMKHTYEALDRIIGEPKVVPNVSMKLLSRMLNSKPFEIVQPPKGYVQE